jgi:hypothetical protein
MSPMLLLHICGGTVGVLSGGVAATFRKGSRRHSVAGLVFVVSMLTLAGSGVYMAVLKSQSGNILGGTLTFYLVATAWMAARHSDGRTPVFDWAALLVVLAVAAVEVTFGIEAAMSPTGMKYDYPPWPYFLFGFIATLAAIGDVRLMVGKGIFGAQRVARHLWRMCFAWFIASASIFMARPQLFPAFMRRTGMLYMLTFLPIVLLIFWMIRVRFKNVYGRIASQYRGPGHGESISRAGIAA